MRAHVYYQNVAVFTVASELLILFASMLSLMIMYICTSFCDKIGFLF